MAFPFGKKDTVMKVIVFRADGSSHVGMGHIMRCLAFADRLQKAGMKVVFLIKAFDRSAALLLKARDVEF
jgi:spore coat polysaccharide biosynthesis predicted glycosyltransferase SpsG